jgi:hypothetical protein
MFARPCRVIDPHHAATLEGTLQPQNGPGPCRHIPKPFKPWAGSRYAHSPFPSERACADRLKECTPARVCCPP